MRCLAGERAGGNIGFFHINLFLVFKIGFLEELAGKSGFVSLIFSLTVFIPNITVGVHRMHITDSVNVGYLCHQLECVCVSVSQWIIIGLGSNPKST